MLFIFYSTSTFANESSFVIKAIDKQLQNEAYWLKLLHYKNGRSIINNNDFFLSSSGSQNPKEELIETINQFQESPELTCKYPARYRWIDKQLDLEITEQKCPELDEFLKPNFKKIHVLFTAERYNSPSSVFGHTFIKLESDTVPYVIDYAAKVPDTSNQFLYAYRGITGKYKSKYTLMPFYLKDFEYRSDEFRDLIDFTLSFTNGEIDNMMLHMFEIRNVDYDYYFLSRNCSSELIKLLDLARYDSSMESDLNAVTIPIDVVYVLQKHGHIGEISKYISKLKQFYKNVEKLNGDETAILSSIVNHQYSIKKFDVELELSPNSKDLIISSAVLYFEIKSVQGNLEEKDMYPLMKLIELQLKYKIESDFEKQISLNRNPVSGKLHKFYVEAKHTSGESNQAVVGYRHLYRHRFDLIDDEKKSGSIEVFDIALRKKENSFSLDHLTLVNVESMPTSNIFFKETINKIRIGAKRLFYDEKLYTYFNYGLGYKYQINDDFDYLVYAKGGVYHNDELLFLASIESSVEYNFSNKYVCELVLEYNRYTNVLSEKSVILNNYIKLSDSTTLHLNLSHKDDKKKYDEISIKYNINF